MSIIIRLQNLPWAANSVDIRRFFAGLSIPEGGVHIVGGEKGDAFIAFSTDEDARQAMEKDGGKIKDMRVKLLLSSRTEMMRVIEQARNQNLSSLQSSVPSAKSSANDSDRRKSSDHGSSPRRREREKSPIRDRGSRRTSSRRDRSRSRSRSRSPRKSRDRDRERDMDRRGDRSKRDDRKLDDSQRSRDERPKNSRDGVQRDSLPDKKQSTANNGAHDKMMPPQAHDKMMPPMQGFSDCRPFGINTQSSQPYDHRPVPSEDNRGVFPFDSRHPGIPVSQNAPFDTRMTPLPASGSPYNFSPSMSPSVAHSEKFDPKAGNEPDTLAFAMKNSVGDFPLPADRRFGLSSQQGPAVAGRSRSPVASVAPSDFDKRLGHVANPSSSFPRGFGITGPVGHYEKPNMQQTQLKDTSYDKPQIFGSQPFGNTAEYNIPSDRINAPSAPYDRSAISLGQPVSSVPPFAQKPAYGTEPPIGYEQIPTSNLGSRSTASPGQMHESGLYGKRLPLNIPTAAPPNAGAFDNAPRHPPPNQFERDFIPPREFYSGNGSENLHMSPNVPFGRAIPDSNRQNPNMQYGRGVASMNKDGQYDKPPAQSHPMHGGLLHPPRDEMFNRNEEMWPKEQLPHADVPHSESGTWPDERQGLLQPPPLPPAKLGSFNQGVPPKFLDEGTPTLKGPSQNAGPMHSNFAKPPEGHLQDRPMMHSDSMSEMRRPYPDSMPDGRNLPPESMHDARRIPSEPMVPARRPPFDSSLDGRRNLNPALEGRRPPDSIPDGRRPPDSMHDARPHPDSIRDGRRPHPDSLADERPPDSVPDGRRPHPDAMPSERRPHHDSMRDGRRPHPDSFLDSREPHSDSFLGRRPHPNTFVESRRPPHVDSLQDNRRPHSETSDGRKRPADAHPDDRRPHRDLVPESRKPPDSLPEGRRPPVDTSYADQENPGMNENFNVPSRNKQDPVIREPRNAGTLLDRSDPPAKMPRGPQPLTVEVRSLPFDACDADVLELFRGIFIPPENLKLVHDNRGKPTGNAFVKFLNHRDYEEGLSRNQTYIGNSCPEVIPCPASAFENSPGPNSQTNKGRGSVHKRKPTQPCEEDLIVELDGLPYSCKDDDIVHFFDGLRILDIYIQRGPNGRATGIGFVEFGTPEDLKASLKMDRKTIGRRYITVSVSSKQDMLAGRGDFQPPSNEPPFEKRTGRERGPPLHHSEEHAPRSGPPVGKTTFCVSLRGLPTSVTNGDIADFFSSVNIIPHAIHIMLDPNKVPTGEAFAEFCTSKELDTAVQQNKKMISGSPVSISAIPYWEMVEILGCPPPGPGPLPPPPLPPLLKNPPEDERRRPLISFPVTPGDANAMGEPMHVDKGEHDSGPEPFIQGRPRPPFEPMDPVMGGRPPFPRMRGPGGPRGIGRSRPFGLERPPRGLAPYRNRGQRPSGMPPHMDSGPPNFGNPGCVVGINNLHYKAGLEELLDVFRGYSLNKDNIIRKYNDVGQATGEARIAFRCPEDAARAVEELNRKPILGRPIVLSLV